MIYVTSDLHGCDPEKFYSLLKKVNFTDDDYCYVLGDVIDRGEHGIELLQFLMQNDNFELLKGNHEAMMLSCGFLFEDVTKHSTEKLAVNDMHALSTWVYNGGQTTIDGMRKLSKTERADIIDYINDAPLYTVLTVNNQDFILTHAGLGNFKESKRMSHYTPEELLWTRPTRYTEYHKNITTIFGHTPTLTFGNEYRGRIFITDTWIDIDTGAAAGLSPALLCLDTMEVFYCEVH